MNELKKKNLTILKMYKQNNNTININYIKLARLMVQEVVDRELSKHDMKI